MGSTSSREICKAISGKDVTNVLVLSLEKKGRQGKQESAQGICFFVGLEFFELLFFTCLFEVGEF